MKILYHHRTYASDGQEIHIRAMQRAFAAEGHQLREVALAPKGAGRVAATDGERAHPSPLLRRAVGFPLLLRELAEYAYTPIGRHRLVAEDRDFGADFIYERYAFGNAGGVLAARRLRIPIVLEVNSPLSNELAATRGIVLPSLARRVEHMVLSSADLIIAVSEELRDIIIRLGAAPDRTLVVPNGVDLELYPRPVSPERRSRLRASISRETGIDMSGHPVLAVFVGYFRRWHRLEMLLEAMAAADADTLHLIVVGDGSIADELRRLALDLGIGDRVHWLGSRPPEAIPDLLTAFDLAVMPGITPYACPLKLIEYMAAGLPTVAPDQSNIRELVGAGESARLFAPGERDSLADALRDVVSDADLRLRLGSAARITVEERRLTWRDNARRVVDEVLAP